MTLNHTISPIENPSKIRASRRHIAKMLTEVNNRKKKASNKTALNNGKKFKKEKVKRSKEQQNE